MVLAATACGQGLDSAPGGLHRELRSKKLVAHEATTRPPEALHSEVNHDYDRPAGEPDPDSPR
ncbi:hypothetical protein GCM10010270_26510 [Streptomyces violaceus]|nr:hypothetical protein GCM10010270_26510 [Streptomyces janthinus]